MKIRIFAGVLFLLGASILLYPSVSAYLNSQNQAKVVEDYSNQVKQMNDAETEKELQKAREFNENLKRTVVIDPFTEEMNQQLSEEYLKILNKNNGQIGTLIIPKDSAEAPVYHGTEAKVLKKGVGHIQILHFLWAEAEPMRFSVPTGDFRKPGCSQIWINWKKEICFLFRYLMRRLPMK